MTPTEIQERIKTFAETLMEDVFDVDECKRTCEHFNQAYDPEQCNWDYACLAWEDDKICPKVIEQMQEFIEGEK